MEKCGHEVPCLCDEYLERLTVKQLENLRIQFCKVITDGNKAIETGNALFMEEITIINGITLKSPTEKRRIKYEKAEAEKAVKKINRVLHEKFGYIVV